MKKVIQEGDGGRRFHCDCCNVWTIKHLRPPMVVLQSNLMNLHLLTNGGPTAFPSLRSLLHQAIQHPFLSKSCFPPTVNVSSPSPPLSSLRSSLFHPLLLRLSRPSPLSSLMKQGSARGQFALYQYSMPITRFELLTLTQGSASHCSALLFPPAQARFHALARTLTDT